MGLTCKNVDVHARDNGNNGVAYFTCSECGARLRSNPNENDGVYLVVTVDNHMETWDSVKYCPSCGAKVTG